MKFEEFPKIPRLNREITITEKIDGTNAQIYIVDKIQLLADNLFEVSKLDIIFEAEKAKEGVILVGDYIIRAGSRNRWLTEMQDNYGFWKWTRDHAEELSKLGTGRHYGEWWGVGIQRGYGLSERRFSLFNTARWNSENPNKPNCCHVVPVLAKKESFIGLTDVLEGLRKNGSYAAPGYDKPEGIVVWHKASQSMYKVTLEKDSEPKSKAA